MKKKNNKILFSFCLMLMLIMSISVPAFATDGTGGNVGNVANAIEQTWSTAREQIVTVVDNVVFPVLDTILAVMFFIKIALCYFDYKKHGTFEFTGPVILFACLIFTLTAPLYIWTII